MTSSVKYCNLCAKPVYMPHGKCDVVLRTLERKLRKGNEIQRKAES